MHITKKEDCIKFLQKISTQDNLVLIDEHYTPIYEFRVKVIEGVKFKIRQKQEVYHICVRLKTLQTEFVKSTLEEVVDIMFLNRVNINSDIDKGNIRLRR